MPSCLEIQESEGMLGLRVDWYPKSICDLVHAYKVMIHFAYGCGRGEFLVSKDATPRKDNRVHIRIAI